MTPPLGKRYVTYVRVSTQQQGRSGLGLEAQEHAVTSYLAAHSGHVIAEYREIESGKVNDRPQLQAALKRCRQTRSTLLVAKLDRLSRDKTFMFTLRAQPGIKLVFADLPDANEMTLDLLTLMASYERDAISTRTKAALAAAKARGIKLGNPRLPAGNAATAAVARAGLAAKADAFATELRDVIDAAKAEGITTLAGIAGRLTELAVPTRRGSHTWTPTAVSRLLARV